MGKRKALSKGKRFDIFRRDGFTCQYCGRQPPEVVLQVDHIVPVVVGGSNDEMNLVTSCRDCNLGKGKKLLDKPQRPDADLAWLEGQQNLAELQAYQRVNQQREALIKTVVAGLQQMWFDYSGLDWCPSDQVIRKMLSQHAPERVEQALMNVAVKESGGYFRRDGDWVRYAWGILRNMAKESDDANT